MPLTEEQRPEPDAARMRVVIGHALGTMSLACCLLFWFQMFLYFATKTVFVAFNGLEWFELMGAAVVLAIFAMVLRSKLWRVALPASVLMFFFTNYVMGS